MKKMDLVERVGISSSTFAKMSNGEIVSLAILEKICEELECDFGDLVNCKNKLRNQDKRWIPYMRSIDMIELRIEICDI